MSTLGVVVFSFAVPVLVFLVIFVCNVLQARRSGRTMKQVLKGTFTRKRSLIGALIFTFAWICLFGWSVAATIYKDHQGLVDTKRYEIAELKKLIPSFNPQCWMESIPLPAPKEPTNARSASEAVIVCNTELKAQMTLDISYDQQYSGVYFPVVVPNTEGVWGLVVTRDKLLSVTLTQGVVAPYKAFVIAVNGAGTKPPVATKIQFR